MSHVPTNTPMNLLDPKNDYVFKRLFGEAPELLRALINDLRPDLPAVQAIEVLNPGIRAEELEGKYIVLDVRARDVDGRVYNVEIQVRRYHAWPQRAMYYLARLLSQQLASGQDYAYLHAVVGIHLLDFDLFTATDAQRQQGYWRFEMRDAHQPEVTLGSVLQLTLIELKKMQRLGLDTQKLSAWVRFFEQWREDGAMEQITHAPVQDALDRLRALSADEEAQRLAWVRERAQHDEATLLKEAREEGREEGREETARETAFNLLRLGILSAAQIAQVTGLTLEQVNALEKHGDASSADPD